MSKTNAKDKMIRSMFFLPESQRKSLRSFSRKHGVPMAEFVRRAIQDRLAKFARMKDNDA